MGSIVPMVARQEPLMTKQQLASYLRVSVRKLEQDIKNGLPFVIVGSRKRFRISDVMRFYGN